VEGRMNRVTGGLVAEQDLNLITLQYANHHY